MFLVLQYDTNEPITKQKQTHGHREQACGCQGVGGCQGGWERGEVGGWVSRCKPL